MLLDLAVDCPDLVVSDWTSLSPSSGPYQYTDTVDISCDNGYEFQDDGFTGSDLTVTCESGGYWSVPRTPTCQRK